MESIEEGIEEDDVKTAVDVFATRSKEAGKFLLKTASSFMDTRKKSIQKQADRAAAQRRGEEAQELGEEIKQFAETAELQNWFLDKENLQHFTDEQEAADLLLDLEAGDPLARDAFQKVYTRDETCPIPLTNVSTTFKDIAGAHRAKQELFTGFIYPTVYPGLFPTVSQGVLLFGPPGTGKTLLAKAAVAELTDVALFAPSPSDLKSKFIGGTEERIKNLFECARNIPPRYKRSIIFIDEIENVAGSRSVSDPGGMAQSVTALLQAMDGITSSENVSVLAATNYPQNIDSAVLRRFSSQIFVDLPDYEARLYLIVQKLIKAYRLPGSRNQDPELVVFPVQSDDVTTGFDWRCFGDCDFEKKFRLFGTNKESTATMFSIEEPCDRRWARSITKQDIFDLVKITGPKNKVKQTMLRQGDFEFDTNAKTTYGMSGSDIDKLLDNVINNAAVRALQGYARPESDFYVTVPTDKMSRKMDLFPVMSERGMENRDKIVTFDLTLFDFCCGLGKFKPTIKNSEYTALLNYQVT